MRVCNRHQWGAIWRVIVAGDACYVAEWFMASIKNAALLKIGQNFFTEKLLGQSLEYVKTSNFPDMYYFLDISGK